MKIIEKVLKTKLQSYGYDVEKFSEQLKQIDFDIIDKQIAFEKEANNYIIVKEFNEPSVEIARTLINCDKFYIQSIIVSGDVNLASSQTSIGSLIPVVDYKLSDNICIVATTINLKVEIIIYNPSSMIMQQYGIQTYENVFSEERNKIAKEYYEAFVENGRVTESKVKGILSLLLSEYVIDEMAITGANPKIKMYDNPEAYAENITEYRLKYINRRTNRVELAYRPVNIKRLGANVEAGLVCNDPYIKLESLPQVANFPLNMISCYWLEGTKNRKEEVAIYIATKEFGGYRTYREFYENDDKKYDDIIENLKSQFQREVGIEVNKTYLLEIIKRLNVELLLPTMSIIRDCMENPADQIEAIKYRFKAISDPKEFEEKLYISIEDNMSRRYKYKLTENILDDLTRVGNKLEYTKEDGEIVRKQSVADFNINASTAIIRRETLIDYSKIPGLLGYIYEDMEYMGTDMLPVPSIEVDFYFPQSQKNEVTMFNGTNFDTDIANISNLNKFNTMNNSGTVNEMPGTTYAIVKYVNSKGEILKENKITNLNPGTPYVPEILPIINDVEGREWICSTTKYPTTIINAIADYNVIEIKYVEKFSKVTITFLNRDGKKLRDDVIETVQTGAIYDLTKREQYKDEANNDWKLITARPQKLLVKEDESKNNLILIYDLEKETVTVRYLNLNGESIQPIKTEDVRIGKMYEVAVQKILIDANGLGWIYKGKTPITHLVEEDKDNTIDLIYEEYKLPVVVKYLSLDGISILNDSVEFLQVGKHFSPTIDEEVADFSCRSWKYKNCEKTDWIVSKNENIINVFYEPLLANVTIQIINEAGHKLLNPIKKQAQIGAEFSSSTLNEVTDNYGKMWTKVEEPKTLIVSKTEAENNVEIKYKPLIATINVKFFDDEKNELIPSKKYERQAGTVFKPEIIEHLESTDGRKWYLDKAKVSELIVRKNIEENIVSIFYEKELTEVQLEFVDVYNKSLRDKTIVKAQIGSVFSEKIYDKIEDREGGKWMLESTEPRKLVVKNHNNNFKLYYGEVKAIVIVKHINVKTNKTILDDLVAKVKLGGIFVPNIQNKILDSNKCQWQFVGDKNFSLVVKENEQENIVLLQYDEVLSKVNVKYQDVNNHTLRNDVTYDLQIGKEIDYKAIDKFIDDNGMGWTLDSSKALQTKVVESGNEVINYYAPMKAKVKTIYINEEKQEIKKFTIDELQVGKTFKPVYDEKVKDEKEQYWKFNEISANEVKVSENGNTIEVKYLPMLSSVVQRFLSKSGETIGKEIKEEKQVGSVIEFKNENIFTDEENKKWNFVKIDKPVLQVKEDDNLNIINIFYEPRMAEIIVKINDDNKNELSEPKKFNAQVGSSYTATLPQIIIDAKTKLGWKLGNNNKDTIKVEENNNVIYIRYDKLMMKVKDRFVDEDGNIIIPDKEKLLQVGANYQAKPEENIKDDNGREWTYSGKLENKFFQNNSTSITVSEKEEQNIVLLKYKPLLVSGTIKYQDNLGNIIAAREEFKAQIGSEYTPEIKEVIVDIKKNKWTYNPNSKATIVIDKDENKNIIILSYEEEKAPIIYKYQDEFGNRLKTPKKELAQIGSLFTPNIDNVIEDEHGRVWEYKTTNVEKLEVKDTEQENVIVVTYVPLNVEVILNLRNRKGEIISKVTAKAQLGGKFKPSLDENIYDDDSKMYRLIKCEPQEILVKEVPIGSNEELNVFDVTYEAVFGNVTILYQDIDGNKLRDDENIQLQVGTKYTPKLVQFVKDRKGIQWENISKAVDTIRVMENPKDNIVKMTFELAKAEVLVRYRDIDGNAIKESSRYQENIGTDFVPEVETIISDAKNRKWIFTMAEPVKITVGSINNVINLIYQEKKSPVVIRFETTTGKKLREDMIVNVQEGVQYIPKKNFAIIYDENEIWSYLEFKPSSLLVTDRKNENVIVQVYTNNSNKNATNKNKIENPFANAIEQTVANENKTEENVTKLEEDKKNIEDNKENESAEIVFKEENLVGLSKAILLEDSEKNAIIKLNQINKEIMKNLDEFSKNFNFEAKDDLIRNIDILMQKEKEIAEKELVNITNDKTGKKLLKIFESIVKLDNKYQKMQERKVILFTDYFVNQNISAIEQANYICERGKNNLELLIMQQKIENTKKNKEELQKIYLDLLYEKSMLNNYYKTRTKAKDEYFINEAEKNSLETDVIIAVTNILPKQAYNLLAKDADLNLLQENELDAIINLLNPQQRNTLEKMIDETQNNKLKKMMTKRLKNIK